MQIRLNGIGPHGRLRQLGNGGSGNGTIGGGGIDNADGENGGGIYPHGRQRDDGKSAEAGVLAGRDIYLASHYGAGN